jgi:hypothetical protein
VITWKLFNHRGNANDTYILIDRKILAQVEDILEVQTPQTQSAFFLKLKILEKSKDKPDAFKRGSGGAKFKFTDQTRILTIFGREVTFDITYPKLLSKLLGHDWLSRYRGSKYATPCVKSMGNR